MTHTCAGCGDTIPRNPTGRTARFCAACTALGAHNKGSHNSTGGYDLALSTVQLRLAVEQATAALELGRPADALAALYAVEAPARLASRLAADVAAGRCGAIAERINHNGDVFEHVRCYLHAGHYYAQRHEGHAVDVGAYQWDDPAAEAAA